MSGQRLALPLALLLLCSASATSFAADITRFGPPDASMTVFWAQGQLIVGVLPQANEGYIQLAQRLLERPDAYQAIAALNRNRPVMQDVRVWVPLVLVKPDVRGDALRALYPEDDLTERGWSHRVTDPLETLIQLTEAYTGSKARFKQLARMNDLHDADVLRLGTEIVIPLEWIPDGLGFRPSGLKGPLTLFTDQATGEDYAVYEVHDGDTLYSLLLRFTDRERAEEVRRMSRMLLKINRLSSERKLRAGLRLRIPVGWLSDEFLVQKAAPPKAPRPVAKRPPPPTSGPLYVIIDPGHGGVDSGAVYGAHTRQRVYEHEVVYDIAMRAIKHLREARYAVFPTLLDPQQTEPVEKLSMKHRGNERVLVSPPYRVTNVRVGINMRIYLIDALYRHLTERQRVPPENIVLISIHGDALVSTMRGAMVYYPDHRLRVHEFSPQGRIYRQRQEARARLIRYDPDDARAAMDLSQEFAQDVTESFARLGLPVSPRKAVRSFYYRNGERTLPGVLRYSRVPISVLLEVANLNNPADRRALLQARTRERIAQALVAAVDRYRDRRTAVALRGSAD